MADLPGLIKQPLLYLVESGQQLRIKLEQTEEFILLPIEEVLDKIQQKYSIAMIV